MSRLRVFSEEEPSAPHTVESEHGRIAGELAGVGVRFEKWRTAATLVPGASADQVLVAYRDDVDRLMREAGYQSVDVVSMREDHPEREAMRRKFLEEHTHSEDEVRFFVGGSGLFTLHIGKVVYEVRCEQGDLISVPAGTPHWFDMGPRPSFIAIRLFTSSAGWVAQFTGADIARRFPRYEPGAAG
jgi:1,2-dihydroxy-3-keto-5-methylthiopentene dioxygenase